MKSKITAIAAIVALSVSSASFAHKHHHKQMTYKGYKGEPAPVCERTKLHDGLYVGLQGGYDSYAARQTTNYVTTSGNFIVNNPMRVNGFLGGASLGYGIAINNLLYLGAEFLGNYTGANGTSSYSVPASLAATTNVQVRTTYGFSVLPGIRPTEASLIYVRLGYNRTNFVINENFATPLGLGGGLVPAAATSNVWKGGFNYGMGIEIALVDRLSMRTEFTHTDYSHFYNGVFSNTLNSSSKFSIADNQFMLGLSYHFDGTGCV